MDPFKDWSPGCGCCGGGCAIYANFVDCANHTQAGAVLTVTQGGVTIGTDTSTSSGAAMVPVPASGTYSYTFAYGDYFRSGTVSVTCPAGYAVPSAPSPAAGRTCCAGENVPTPAGVIQCATAGAAPSVSDNRSQNIGTTNPTCIWRFNRVAQYAPELEYVGAGIFRATHYGNGIANSPTHVAFKAGTLGPVAVTFVDADFSPIPPTTTPMPASSWEYHALIGIP